MVGKATKLRLAKRPMTLGFAAVAQLVERVLGKDEVMGSSPISSFCVGKIACGGFSGRADSLGSTVRAARASCTWLS